MRLPRSLSKHTHAQFFQLRAYEEMKWWTFRVAVEIIVGFDESEPVAGASHSVSASINCICCGF